MSLYLQYDINEPNPNKQHFCQLKVWLRLLAVFLPEERRVRMALLLKCINKTTF